MKKRRFIRLFIMSLIGIVLALGLTTAAKYVTDKIQSWYLKSKDFYFSSDLLDTSNTHYQIGTWSGVGSFDIDFKLYAKENELLASESDITYTITVSQPINASGQATDATATANISSGTIYANNQLHEADITVTVNPSRVFIENESITLTITAKSTSPYKKEIKGTFTYIVGREGISYEIDDETNRTYLNLKITNDIDYCTVITPFGNYSLNDHISDSVYRTLSKANQAKCVSQYITLQFDPEDLLLDSTSSVLEIATTQTRTINSIQYINYMNFAIAPNSTLTIKYYKLDPSDNYKYPSAANPTSIITLTASDPT